MKSKFYLLLTITFLFVVQSCKKYEDGPMLSLRSKKSRVEGDWRVTSFKINNESLFNYTYSSSMVSSCGSTENYNETYSISNYKWNLSKSGTVAASYSFTNYTLNYTDTYNSCYPQYDIETGNENYGGTWDFGSDKESLILILDGDAMSLNILELKNNSMHLNGIVDGDVVDVLLMQ